jgi:hypothetical protein
VGSAADLRFVRVGALAGYIEYGVTGPELAVLARSDFGEGQPYPSTTWSCVP